ncbi:MAG: Gfo/Idh/MocA family oxidoreductase [Candidatus Poribacteria bacterium]|nr:Gfo/Idh/MocA family oxidoreductase [Candidatus Poribacteria bacterium]
MRKSIRWGILSTGRIAHQFATGLSDLPDTELVAVGSRSIVTANAFANQFNIPHRHGSYDSLAQDPDVDVIYIATPHSLHQENALMCLKMGKAVLCEKPFTINVQQAEVVIQVAREKGIFLMEAMWTRFLPHILKVQQIINDRLIGQPRILQASVGDQKELDPSNRFFNPKLGGGALIDVGIYAATLAHLIFGPPTAIQTLANLSSTGVDQEALVTFQHSDGQLTYFASSILYHMPRDATITGDDGSIYIHSDFWHPSQITLRVNGKTEQFIEVNCPLNGYHYQVLEVNQCLRAGKSESSIMSLDTTLSVMNILDTIRGQWGLKYPME